MPRARRLDQYLHHGALSRRVAAGDHLHARTVDGQGGGSLRHRPGRDPPPQPDRQISLHVRRPAWCSTRRATRRRWRWRSRPSTCRPSARARKRRAHKGRYLGIGFATFSERTGYGSPAFAARGMEITPGWETVILTVDPSGFVEARIGSSPHGQGLRTTLAQIIADEIGVTPDMIKVVHGDTDRAPYGWGTFASRSLVISGGATLDRGAESARQADQDRQPHAGSRARRHRAGGRRGQGRRHRPLGHDREHGARGLHADPPLQGRDRAGTDRDRHLRSARHFFQCLPRRDRRGRYRDRPRHDREIPGRRRRRPHHQSDDRRRPGAWRHRAGHRQRAAGGDHLRRRRRHPDRQPRRLHAADRARNSADRAASHGDAEREFDHQGQGSRRRRRHRRAGGGHQRHQRRAVAVRRADRRNAGDAAAHPRGLAYSEERAA